MRSMPIDHEASLALVKDILKDDYVHLDVERLELVEDLAAGKSAVRLWLRGSGNGERPLEGEGVGLVDAVFASLVSRLRVEYPSLQTVTFVRFQVNGKLAASPRGGADSPGEVHLAVRNSAGRQFEFAVESRSITAGAVRAVAACVEFFVNSERAYVVTRRALKDAEERRREDLVQSYTERLVELVKNTSYADVAERESKR